MRSFSRIRAVATEGLRRVGEATLSLLYPPHCAGCGRETPAEAHLCEACLRGARRIREPFCARCSEPFDGAISGEFTCAECGGRDFHFQYAVAPYRAAGVVRELIHRFKYNRDFYLRHALAAWLAEGLADARLREPLPELLVPVPLHPAREREREFNQATELGELLSARSGIPLLEALRRTRYTTTQTQLDREKRMENLRGAFRLRQHAEVTGRHLLLIDDVYTTGSTVEECARILRLGGAASVRVLTVARAIAHS